MVATVLGGCAHTREEVRSASVTNEAPPEREVIAVDTPPPYESAPAARPRLSQTVTLGQGTPSQYTPSAPPPAPGAQQSPNVVVNNNIVVGGAPAYGGYGGYGYRGGYTGAFTSFEGGARARPQPGTTGWEGARRTAAPGQTPGVGGNWAPVPSYGPAQMK